jgi:AcrR family transcriptional regulator
MGQTVRMGTDSDSARAPRGPYRTGIRRRGEIIDSATRVFGRHGFARGTLREIAAEVGVSPAALMRHFATKEELLIAVLQASEEADSEQFFGGATGMEHFDHSSRLVAKNARNRGLVELLLTVATEASHPDHPARPFMRARYQSHVEGLAAHLRTARDRGEIRPLTDAEIEHEARGYIALMDGLELQWLLDPDFDLLSAWEYHYLQTRARWTRDAVTPRRDPEK